MPFEDLSGTSDLKWLSKGIAVTITSDLRKLPGLLILERAQLEAALSEVRLAQAGMVDEKTAAAAGRLIGADLLVLGEYQEYGGTLRITARFVEAETSQITGMAKVTGKMDEIFDLQDRIVLEISKSVGVTLTPEREKEIKKAETNNLNAYEWSSKAWEAYDFLIGKGDVDTAISYLEKALQYDANYAAAYNNLGVAYIKKGLYDQAISFYKKALEIDGDNADVHYNLAIAYDYQGDYDRAAELYRKAISINPDDPKFHNNLGLTYDSLGMMDEAISEYRRVLELDPDNIEAHNNLGVAYRRMGMISEALMEHERVLALKPNDAGTHYNLGLLYLDLADYERAVSEFETAIRLEPGYLSAYKNLGVIYEDNIVDKEKALYYYRKYLELGGDDPRVSEWIKRLTAD
jgi:Flp pilus assembly protein TadD/TolB-like protein